MPMSSKIALHPGGDRGRGWTKGGLVLHCPKSEKIDLSTTSSLLPSDIFALREYPSPPYNPPYSKRRIDNIYYYILYIIYISLYFWENRGIDIRD